MSNPICILHLHFTLWYNITIHSTTPPFYPVHSGMGPCEYKRRFFLASLAHHQCNVFKIIHKQQMSVKTTASYHFNHTHVCTHTHTHTRTVDRDRQTKDQQTDRQRGLTTRWFSSVSLTWLSSKWYHLLLCEFLAYAVSEMIQWYIHTQVTMDTVYTTASYAVLKLSTNLHTNYNLQCPPPIPP